MLAQMGVTLALATGVGASGATAATASLAIAVAPATVHTGERYRVAITGTYDTRAVQHPPYLLAFIQYSDRPCRATATAEYRLPDSAWDWDFYPEQAQPRSPFKNVVYWKAGSRLGDRRVCAYLYAKRVTPGTTAPPLTRASARFSNSRPAKTG